jgi:hypothetical protein
VVICSRKLGSQRLVKILNHVLSCLYSYRYPDQTLGNPQLLPIFFKFVLFP